MKTGIILTGVVLSIAFSLVVNADSAIDELNMGLSQTSVFDTPTPEAFTYSTAKAGKSEVLPRAWPGIPPLIPHRIDEYLPIVAEDNQCRDCHEKPKLIGREPRKGKSPMSRSHYVDQRGDSDEMSDELVGARFVCTQCHVPQSGAPALVENTFQLTD